MRTWILQQLALVGKSWDARHPFMDAALASGHRVHVTFPPASRQGILISHRRLPRPSAQRASRWSHSPLYPLLKAAVQAGDSLIISGATGSGGIWLAFAGALALATLAGTRTVSLVTFLEPSLPLTVPTE